MIFVADKWSAFDAVINFSSYLSLDNFFRIYYFISGVILCILYVTQKYSDQGLNLNI